MNEDNLLYIENIEYLSEIDNESVIDICINSLDYANYIHLNLSKEAFDICAPSLFNKNEVVEVMITNLCIFSSDKIKQGRMKFSLDFGKTWILETNLSSKEEILNSFRRLMQIKTFI